MSIENGIELASGIVAIILLWLGVPKSKRREAYLSLLFMQMLTWFLGGLVVEWGLISYPVRFFSHAFRTNFTFEFLVFPVVSVLFNLYFPGRGTSLRKTLYSVSFPTVIIIGETIVEKYTDNIEYIHWNWFWSWSAMLVTLLLSYRYYKWFFSKSKYRTTQND